MNQKYSLIWKWFLTIYLIYLVIYIFLQYLSGTPSYLFWIVIGGNLLAIFSAYNLMQARKIKIYKLFQTLLLATYILFVLFNTLIFGFGLISDFWIYIFDLVIAFNILGILLPIVGVYPVIYTLTTLRFSIKGLFTLLWGSYLWLITIFMCLVLIIVLIDIKKWTFFDYLVSSTIILFIVTMYSYYYKVRLFNYLFWKIYFWIIIIWSLGDFLNLFLNFDRYIPDYLKSYSTPVDIPTAGYIALLIMFLPTYYPLYKITFDKNFFNKKS